MQCAACPLFVGDEHANSMLHSTRPSLSLAGPETLDRRGRVAVDTAMQVGLSNEPFPFLSLSVKPSGVIFFAYKLQRCTAPQVPKSTGKQN